MILVRQHIISAFKSILLVGTVLWMPMSCQKDQAWFQEIPHDLLVPPKGFPSMEFPPKNKFTQIRWELGKKLFYDPILSIDSSISCGSCHKPALSFADDVATTPGAFQRPGTRNAPSLANVGYKPHLLREGSVPTLEMQVLVPIQEHNEFDHNIVDISEDLNTIVEYVQMSQEAYGRNPDPYVISRSLGVFQRTLISGNSSYDQFVNGDQNALTPSELSGRELFMSPRTQCASCHNGFNFSNYQFANTGLFETYEDVGRFRFTLDSADLSVFVVPSLRNVELTAPYMHKGQLSTLEEVVDHYDSGGKNHPNKSLLIAPLGLSASEKTDLVNFLKSLTDHEFVKNPLWNP